MPGGNPEPDPKTKYEHRSPEPEATALVTDQPTFVCKYVRTVALRFGMIDASGPDRQTLLPAGSALPQPHVVSRFTTDIIDDADA